VNPSFGESDEGIDRSYREEYREEETRLKSADQGKGEYEGEDKKVRRRGGTQERGEVTSRRRRVGKEKENDG